ncbi:hypothetical protein Poli38472_004087 [Pythium oligandrum]|uniref:Uncharacterized protein n=1 Tax=Pythium oligandrum TaxID=41045 RepID=A0A8K1CML1_PYTOL|nr:hypothetical protein Poli38472_004087 [Pythium oligandrum]|eukprot:TMW66322.1 hypothetical protein Poli38472_004087 [Pythium oligandrum]
MVTDASSMTAMGNGKRRLAQQLLSTRGQGIAVFVQERVHSTSVGLDATTAFVQELLTELELAVEEYLTSKSTDSVQLDHEEELELGTLISASSLTIRYVTERNAMTAVLDRFRSVFQTVLRYPVWTTPFLGLKMVALMGSTRSLESFGDSAAADTVMADLRWLFSLFTSSEVTEEELVTRFQYLFRPTCEHLTVVMQSHPTLHAAIFVEVMPQLLHLLVVFTRELEGNASLDQAKAELPSAIAVLLDMKLPAALPSAFSLLPMPPFIQVTDVADVDENVHLLQREESQADEDPLHPLVDTVDFSESCDALTKLLESQAARVNAVALIPFLGQLFTGNDAANHIETLVHGLLASVETLELQTPGDFEYYRACIEALRDLGLRSASIPASAIDRLYAILKSSVPHLQSALKTVDADKAQLRTIKLACSATRDLVVETFVFWIYQDGGAHLVRQQADFVEVVVEKLADPRLYGDVLYVLKTKVDDETFNALVSRAICPLLKASKQLDRYSKSAASRILEGVLRVAVASGPAIVPFADELVLSILPIKGRPQQNRLNTIACILLSCVQDSSFVFDDHSWVSTFLNLVFENAHNAIVLSVLLGLIRVNTRLKSFVAKNLSADPEVVGHIVHRSLTAWPIYEEDVDTVILVLEVLAALLDESAVKEAIHVSALAETLTKLSTNARQDDLVEIADSCDQVLDLLTKSTE